eukprot:39008_1
MSVEESRPSTEVKALVIKADRGNDREIGWTDFCAFCDEHHLSTDFRKSIWKQLGGDEDETSKILFNKDSFLSFYSNETHPNEDYTQNSSNLHDEHESDAHELILEFEISDDEIIENNDTPSQPTLSTHPNALKSPHNRLKDISQLFSKYDTYHNGTLIQSEFISMIIELYPNADQNTLSDLFKLLDRNDDGTFDYKYRNCLELFQTRLNSYAQNMLSGFEFCNELKKVYCGDLSTDFDSNSTVYDDEDAISIAYTLKKELDYALSVDSNQTLHSLRLSCLSLWQWIQNHGLSSIHDNFTLRKQSNDLTARNKVLQQDIVGYEERMHQLRYQLHVSERDRDNMSSSLDSLQFELQQMAMQLSQEQNVSDTNSQEIDKLKSSLQRSQITIQSLQNKRRGNGGNIWIESQSRMYAQTIEHLEHSECDECADVVQTVGILHRDHSYDLPNESEIATTMNEEDREYIEQKQHERNKTKCEDVDVSVHDNEIMNTVESIQNIEDSLDTQKAKLDMIIDLVKRLDMCSDEDEMCLKRKGHDQDDGSSLPKFKNVLPLMMGGIVCFSAYKAYKYQTRK